MSERSGFLRAILHRFKASKKGEPSQERKIELLARAVTEQQKSLDNMWEAISLLNKTDEIQQESTATLLFAVKEMKGRLDDLEGSMKPDA